MNAKTEQTLRVGLPIPPRANIAHLLLAKSLGYAEEEGLHVSYHVVDGPDLAIEGASRGEFDVAIGNTVFAFRMRERATPVRAFYSTCRAVYRSFAVLADSPVVSVSQLSGGRIGTDFPDLLDLAYPTLRDEGINPERDVTFLPRTIPVPGVTPTTAELERIRSGEFAGIWVLGCGYEMLVDAGLPLRKLPTRTLDRLTPSEFMYASEETLSVNADSVSRFGRAVAKASVFCDTNPEAAVRLVREQFPDIQYARDDDERALRLDIAGLRGRTERGMPQHGRDPRWGSVTLDELQEWEDFLIANGGIHERHPLEEYVDAGLVDVFNDFDLAVVEEQARQWPHSSQR